MSKSLKAFIPIIAKAVDMTPAALYERQRALVRAGLLRSEGGRGPGSGVRATPESLALLLISLLATDSLSETEAKTKIVANLKSATKRCPLTGKKTFAGAVTAVLASEDLAKQARWLEVARGGSKSYAHISYPPDEHDEQMVSRVETRSPNREATSPNRAMATWVRPKKSQFGFMGAIGQSPLVLQASLNLPLDEYARALKETDK